MKRLHKTIMGVPALGLVAIMTMGSEQASCSDSTPSSDQVQREQQEQILAEGTRQTGMPAIVNFRERKLLKTILELRDQENYTTYTYQYVSMTGKLVPFCHSIGYPIPYATEYTSPQKPIYGSYEHEFIAIPQADPNGLFSPASADGTWIMCKDPRSDKVAAVYSEPRVISAPFPLTDEHFPGDKQ